MIEIKHRESGEILRRVKAETLAGADFRGINLSQVDLSYTDLTRAVLVHADLTGANLRGATLREARLQHANFQDADLSHANLVGVRLLCANLTHANLTHANLNSANLEGVVLCRADLGQANLAHADLRSANLRGAVLEGVRYDDGTRWPDDSNRPSEDPDLCSQVHEGNRFRRAGTRRVGEQRSGTVRLWTLQELPVWERLLRSGALYTDPDCLDPSHLSVYRWMQEQMARYLPDSEGHYPWWAWFRPKPDLRRWHSRCFPPGSRRVRLELAVPEHRVLLSDYMGWHMVLNRSYLPITDEESERWEMDLDQRGISDVAWPLPEPWQSRVVASWERIFDLDALAAGGIWSTDQVQATFERLELADVVGVTYFNTR